MKNLKLKGVVAAVAMVISSAASAVILPSYDGSGSSLVLTAYDDSTTYLLSDGITTETVARGIAVDLGVTLSEYVANPATAFTPVDVSTLFQDTFINALNSEGNVAPSDLSKVRWNITAGDWGIDLSTRQALMSRSTEIGAPALTNGQLDGSVYELYLLFTELNRVECGLSCGFTSPADGANPAVRWNERFNGQNANNNTAALGAGIDMYLSHTTTDFVFGSLSIVPGNQSLVTGPFTTNFTLDTTGKFASVSSVPVPAAVWLFGSGLVGLVGVGRRRAAA